MKSVIREPLDRPHLKSNVSGVSKTEQSHKAKCCLNRIMASVHRTGQLPPPLRPPEYGDVSGLNKPYDQLINHHRDVTAQVAETTKAQAAEAAKARKAAAKAARDAEIEAAVQKRLAEKGSSTS